MDVETREIAHLQNNVDATASDSGILLEVPWGYQAPGNAHRIYLTAQSALDLAALALKKFEVRWANPWMTEVSATDLCECGKKKK